MKYKKERIIEQDNEKCLCKLMAEHNIEFAEMLSHNMNFHYTARAKCYECKDPYNTKCKDYKRFK